jgi:parvulin-like peptidyl-prolyl isomerase
MFRLAMMCLLAAVSAGQTPNQPARPQAAPAPPAPPQAAVSAEAVADTQAVITIHGLCPGAAATATRATASRSAAKNAAPTSAKDCVTTVTKGQLDKLIGVLNTTNQPVTPQIRRQFAQNYVELLTYGEAAKRAGADDANFAELMRFVRLSTLARVYRTRLEEQYRKPADKDIEAYYNGNKAKYEEIKLSRIFIPAKNPSVQDKDAWEKKAAQTANELHDRAVKGEDMEKLQKEAYTALGLTTAPFPTNMGARRHGALQPVQEQELFALKPGEISKVEQEAAGYSFYKVESKDVLPLEKVKDEISHELAHANMEAKTKEINSGIHADLNESYFGPAAAPGAPASLVPPGPAGRPGAAPASQTGASPSPVPSPKP